MEIEYLKKLSASTKIIDLSAQEDDYFSISFEPNCGVKVKTRDNDLILLGNIIGSGGEGAVYGAVFSSSNL